MVEGALRQPCVIGERVLWLEEASSTNTLVLESKWLNADGWIICARHQTAGRGRQGRSWQSVPGAQLQCTVVIHPQRAPAELYALLGGVAVAEAVRSWGVRLHLKWPNDLYAGRAKVGGILVERRGSEGRVRLALGIGVNCLGAAKDLPPQLCRLANTLSSVAGRPITPQELLQALTPRLAYWHARLEAGQTAALLDAWRAYGLRPGQRVRFSVRAAFLESPPPGDTPATDTVAEAPERKEPLVEALVCDINAQGHLVVQAEVETQVQTQVETRVEQHGVRYTLAGGTLEWL